MDNKPKDILPEYRKLFQDIKRRTALHLGSNGNKLSLLKIYLDGAAMSEFLFKNESKATPGCIPCEFYDFLENYYNTGPTCLDAFSIIVNNEADESSAFKKFWELLDIFLESLGYEPIQPIQHEAEATGYVHSDGVGKIYYTDIDKLVKSYINTFNAPPWNDDWNEKTAFNRLRNLYHAPDFVGLAVWRENYPVGVLIGRREQYFDREYFRIEELWVEPAHQKNGYAKMLLDELMYLCKSWSIKKIYLITSHGEATEKFYIHNGFSVISDMCVMDKFIDEYKSGGI